MDCEFQARLCLRKRKESKRRGEGRGGEERGERGGEGRGEERRGEERKRKCNQFSSYYQDQDSGGRHQEAQGLKPGPEK
jgi:hypothetical protein